MHIICSQIEGKKGIMAYTKQYGRRFFEYTKQYFTVQPEDVKLNTLFKVIMGCIAIIIVSIFAILFLYLLLIEQIIKLYNSLFDKLLIMRNIARTSFNKDKKLVIRISQNNVHKIKSIQHWVKNLLLQTYVMDINKKFTRYSIFSEELQQGHVYEGLQHLVFIYTPDQ